MRLEIEVPPKEQTIREGCEVALATRGAAWTQSCLGIKAKDMGVYVIHHSGNVKYVGKTNGPAMSFGMRLRREFQESAAGGKHVYPQPASLGVPPPIMVSLFPAADIKGLVRATGVNLSDYQAIEIFEAVLIQTYQPDFQRHQEKRTLARIKKLGITTKPEDLIAILKAKPST
jgi:hypothetical protein